MNTIGTPNFPKTIVVKNIILLNIVMLLVKVLAAQFMQLQLNDYFAIYDWQSVHFKPFQFITHMFTHGQDLGPNFSISNFNRDNALALQGCVSHLAYNMLFLFIFGSFLEQEIGIKKMFFLFFACGIAAALSHFVYKH
jgi:membrane associated rhomboid family serine protease